MLHVPTWQPWTPEAPNLHTLTVRLAGPGGAAVDGVTVRFGMRTVGVSGDGTRVLINGEPVKLLGFNRHDMYPQVGPSLSMDVYKKDIALLKGMGSNFIRGCHYPQDQRFLDLCDESGMLVWHEALAWGNYADQLTDPLFMAAEVGTANAMVDSSINNPSVILWGFFNEGESNNPKSTPSYAKMSQTFKGRDPSRLVTWASNRQTRDKGFAYADVISFNGYPGWYGGSADTVVDTWDKAAAWVRQNWPTKPFIVSETGAGGVAGNHSHNLTRWSEEFQGLIDSLDAGVAANSSNISGISMWQFTDCKVDQTNTSTNRPGGINNKGVLTQFREPKLAAAAVRQAFKQGA